MIEASLVTLLSPFCSLSPDIAPDGSSPPYVIYSTSRTPGNYVDNSIPLERIRLTIDVHHTSRYAARYLAEGIKSVLRSNVTFGGYVIGDQDIYESEVKLYRVVIDYELFASSFGARLIEDESGNPTGFRLEEDGITVREME